MGCSPSGCSVHGILQARILEWVAIYSSRGPSQPSDQTRISYVSHIEAGSLPLVPPGKSCSDMRSASFLEIDHWRGTLHFFVLRAPSWWLEGPGPWSWYLTWPGILYVLPNYSWGVLEVSPGSLFPTLLYLISCHLFFFVLLESSLPPMMPFSCSLPLYPLALPIDLSSTHPHWAVIPLLSPHWLLLSLA